MRIAFLITLFLGAGCSTEGPGGEEITYLVTITNQWADASDGQHFFQLNAAAGEATEQGAFTGCERRPTPSGQNTFHGCPNGFNDDGQDEYEVEGTWQDNTVTLRTARPGGTRTFRAPVTSNHPTTLRFVDQGNDAVLVLTRGE